MFVIKNKPLALCMLTNFYRGHFVTLYGKVCATILRYTNSEVCNQPSTWSAMGTQSSARREADQAAAHVRRLLGRHKVWQH
jgi:hypothetical protein